MSFSSVSHAQVRYQRLMSRGRAGEGVSSLEDFIEVENREQSTEATGQQLDNTFALHQVLVDNGGSVEELHVRIEEALKQCEK